MDLLETSQCNKIIIELLQGNMELVHAFDQVYLFGSVLAINSEPEDVDILLVYKEYNDNILKDITAICSYLEKKSQMVIDLTVLSANEMIDTAFLEKIGKYKRLK